MLGSGAALLLLPLVSFGWKRERIREVEAEIIPAGEEDLPPIAVVRTAPDQPPVAAVPPEEEKPPLSVSPVAPVEEEEVEAASSAAAAPVDGENEPEAEAEPDPASPPEPEPLHEVLDVRSEEREEHEDEAQTITDAAAPLVSTADWNCEIALWREDDQAVFYARAFHDDIEIPLAESPPFGLGAGGALERTPAAIEAHRRLFDELKQDGWLHVERGPEWYGDRFQRAFSVGALNSSLKARLLYTRRP